MELYQHHKYPVFRGKQGSHALCVPWMEVEGLISAHPLLKERFCMIGTLYSTEGVSIIVRNLLLEPEVEYLYLWAAGALSRTAIGRKGWEYLLDVWKGDFSRLHREIGREEIQELVENVRLIDVSGLKVEELVQRSRDDIIKGGRGKAYSFPEPVKEIPRVFPSEKVGWVFHGKLQPVWKQLLYHIMRYGEEKKTEYGSAQRELKVATWVIEPEESPEEDYEYASYFLDPARPKGASYTYGERLRAGFDQIGAVIDKLRANPESRRAVATTLKPEEDLGSASPPCLNLLQFIAEDELHLIAVFRSHDIYKAAIPNARGLMAVQRHVAERLGIPCGKIAVTSNSAHIYEEDWSSAEKDMASGHGFVPDPRGLVRISADKMITARLESYEGDLLAEHEASTARGVAEKLLWSLSDPGHYVDIAIELVKAEIALKKGLPYTQDKEIRLDGFSLQ